MPKLPEPRDPTLDAVDAALVRNNPPESRDYLGISELGPPCQRRLWLKHRKVKVDHIDAQGLRNIEDGNRGEPIMAERLKAVPDIRLHTEDPKTGKQFAVVNFSGHVRGHLDGVIKGIFEAPKTWHIWEHKQVSEKRYRDLLRKKEKFGEKNALAEWDETYFCQAICYMGLLKPKAKRHYMTVATAGGRNYTSVRTEFDPHAFKIFMDTAAEIIEAKTPPPPISSKADYYICNWCHFNEFCHEKTVTADVNCRTCAHATPMPGDTDRGTWWCELHDKRLTKKRQRDGCPKHLFIPELIPWAHVHQLDRINNRISYRTEAGNEFVNAEHNAWELPTKEFTSKDLQHIRASNIDNNDLMLEALAKFEGARIERIEREKKGDADPLDDPLPKWL